VVEYNFFREKIAHYFNKYGLHCSEGIIDDFYAFTAYLISENGKYNLTAITDPDEMITKHHIDSILLLKYFEIPKGAKLIDIGTGAGFPALPLYIMRKELRITCLDSTGKKINFVKNAAGKIGGRDFAFYCGRAEDYGRHPGLREGYDLAVSRAVAKLAVLCELAAPFVRPGGHIVAYKSKNAGDEIAGAQSALKTLGLDIAEVIEFELEETHKRSLVIIRKLYPTPPRYPRPYREITKHPL